MSVRPMRAAARRFSDTVSRIFQIDARSLLRDSAWLTGSRMVAVATGMILTIAFANLLSPEVFGTYKYLIAAAGTVSAFSLNALGSALMRTIARGNRNAVPGVVRIAAFASVPASLAAAGIGAYYLIQGNVPLGAGFLLIAVSNVLGNAVGLAKAILSGTGDFKAIAVTSIPRTIVTTMVVIGALFLTQNILIIFAVYVGVNLVASATLYFWTLRKLQIHPSSEGVSETVRYGTHLSILGFFILIANQADQLLVWHSVGAAALAIYALALAPVQEMKNLLDITISTAFPKIANKSGSELRIILPLRLLQTFVVSAVATFAYVLLIPFLFIYLFPAYQEAIIISQLLAITILFQPKSLLDMVILIEGAVRMRYAIILTSQVIKLGLIASLIPIYGLWGGVMAIILSEALSMILYIGVYFIKRNHDYRTT